MHLHAQWSAIVEATTNRVFYYDFALKLSCWEYPFNYVLEHGWKRELNHENIECFRDATREVEAWSPAPRYREPAVE